MANSVVPSFHGCPKFILSNSPSTTAPPPHLSLLIAAPRFPSVSPLLQKSCSPNGFSPLGVEKVRRKDRNSGGVVEMEGFDDEDEDEMLLPLGEMENWLESKPRGFGVGKVYDTSVEDKLLEEIEQSLEAQAANINKLKNAPVMAVPKKDTSQLKAIEETPSGIRVRVSNLPKKKNVHRDLKLAFRGTSGILNIVPAVSGNNKTRDPVCKGFAFVYFKLEKDAVRFVQTFSRQSISFGKVQKQIKCEVVNPPRSSFAADGESESKTYDVAASQPTESDLEGQLSVSFVVDDSVSDSWEDLDSEEESDLDDDLLEAELEETNEEMENLALSGVDRSNSMGLELVSPNAPSSSERPNRGAVSTKGKSRPSRQKPSGKGNGVKLKVPKLHVPGSAKRLKIKEKAMLNGVFSKYGAKAVNAVNEES